MTSSDETRLLHWARQAVEAAVQQQPPPTLAVHELSPALEAPQAAFVTLLLRGELRGCIGLLDRQRPLWQNVLDAAAAAALEDSRFPPVTPDELPGLRLEISVLDPPQDLVAVAQFDPQQHGIIVQRGATRALLLPKVARQHGWGAEQVLAAVCEKAGLAPDAWRQPGTALQVFTATDFGG